MRDYDALVRAVSGRSGRGAGRPLLPGRGRLCARPGFCWPIAASRTDRRRGGGVRRKPARRTPLRHVGSSAGRRCLGDDPAQVEDILALLTRAGFSGTDALHIYRALFGFLHGHVLDELQELIENPDETDDLLRLGLYRLPIREFPLLRGLAPALASYDGAAELERGLDILLTGLTDSLTPARPRSQAPGPPADDLHRER